MQPSQLIGFTLIAKQEPSGYPRQQLAAETAPDTGI